MRYAGRQSDVAATVASRRSETMLETQAFESHPLWAQVEAALSLLAETTPGATPGSEAHRERVRFVGAHVLSFKAVDSRLFVQGMLDSVQQSFAQIEAHLGNYRVNLDPSQLNQAVNYADGVMGTVAGWPTVGPRGGAAAKARQEFEFYSAEVTKALEALGVGRQEIQKEMDDLHARLREDVAGLRTQLEVQNSSFDALKSGSASELARLAAEGASLTKSQEEAFDAWFAERRESWNSAATEVQQELDQLRADSQHTAKLLRDVYENVEKMAGDTTSAVLARNHGTYAKREWVSGLVAYGIGFAALFSAAGVLAWIVHGLSMNQTMSWQFVALKAGLGATIIGGASVAFSLGRRLLQRADDNKRIELELRALGPFLADVDYQKVQEAKLDFAKRRFGVSSETDRESNAVDATALLKQIVELLAKNRG